MRRVVHTYFSFPYSYPALTHVWGKNCSANVDFSREEDATPTTESSFVFSSSKDDDNIPALHVFDGFYTERGKNAKETVKQRRCSPWVSRPSLSIRRYSTDDPRQHRQEGLQDPVVSSNSSSFPDTFDPSSKFLTEVSEDFVLEDAFGKSAKEIDLPVRGDSQSFFFFFFFF